MDALDSLVSEPLDLVLADNPQLDDALILRMTYDLATGMHNGEVIARRYGLADADQLKDYLRQHPNVVHEAKRLRSLFQSDEATEGRIRAKFLRATEQLIIPIAALVADPRTPINSRIDGFKQIQRGAGVDGVAAGAKDQGRSGAAFSLTINFAGGRDSADRRAEEITGTTVVDAGDIPGLDHQLRLTADDTDIPEEDV
jgi:hypothetical protein